MNTWWHDGEATEATSAETPPATLLHLLTITRVAEPVHWLLTPLPPPAAATTNAFRREELPQRRLGFVKQWPARAVDLAALLDPPPPSPSRPASGTGQQAKSAGIAEALSLARARREALARRLLIRLQPPPAVLLRAHGPLTWPAEFFPYQLTGIQALLRQENVLLGDEMGLGKTVQAVAALRVLCYRHDVNRALIIAPASLLAQWRQEIAKWAPELRVMTLHGDAFARRQLWQYRAHITLTSYDTLREDADSLTHGPRAESWDVVVLDEAQRIKNRHTAIARICKRLPRQRAWALTGTPMENSPEDTASILEFVTGQPVSSDGPALRAALNQYQLRRRKVDVLRDLPPKLLADITLIMSPAQRRAYDRAEQDGIIALRGLGEVRVEHILALISHLKRLCNFSPEGESVKLDDLRRRLDELTAEGHRALIFTQYTGDDSGARRIAAGLRRFAPLVFTGELSLESRHALIEQFQRGAHPVMILSLRAGGQGLNLQQASYVFHFDRWWNPAVERQAEDRAHRIGQQHPVHIYRYLIADTIEERIDQLLRRKSAQFTDLIETASLDLARFVTKEELATLFEIDPRL